MVSAKSCSQNPVVGGIMTNYVWSATDKSGQKVIREIEAATANDAKYVLLAQGYSDLELKLDDVDSTVQAGFPTRENAFGAKIKVAAAERLRHRDNPTVTYWDALRKGVGQSSIAFLALAVLAVYSGYRGHWGSALFYIAVVLTWLTYILFWGLQSVYFRKLIEADDWNRWHEVLSLVETLKVIGHFRKVKVPASALIRHRAKALAGLGRLNEALEEYKHCEGLPDCPGWLYKLFVAGLYGIAKQYDQAIECNLASIALKPTPTAWLDLANRYARYKRDPKKAREAMAEAEKSPLTDVAKPFHLRCQGIIAYLEHDYAAARCGLEAAIELAEKAKGRPYRDGRLSVSRAYLCCVLAKQGDLAGAKKCFALAKDYLVATKEDDLLTECRQLTGEA
jgi:tetratricopeptide (TPR) repeat protein